MALEAVFHMKQLPLELYRLEKKGYEVDFEFVRDFSSLNFSARCRFCTPTQPF
jgi:hypothetical protein